MAAGFSRTDALAMSEAEMETTLQLIHPPARQTPSDSGGREVTRVKSLRKSKSVENHAKS